MASLTSGSNTSIQTPETASRDVRATTGGFAGRAAIEDDIEAGAETRAKARGGGLHENKVLSIIDKDQRVVELRNKVPPWRMICALEIESAKGPYRGTGWLAGPRTVVTSGHCVFSPERFGGWARAITVSPGRSWRGQPFGAHRETAFSCADAWRLRQDRAADVGCIHLSEPLGDEVGWMRFGVADGAALVGLEALAAGYPEYAGTYDNLLKARGPVRASRDGRLYYAIDTTDGQSGSPVWKAADADPMPTVLAIHAYETSATPAGISAVVNSGTLISKAIEDLILRWQESRT